MDNTTNTNPASGVAQPVSDMPAAAPMATEPAPMATEPAPMATEPAPTEPVMTVGDVASAMPAAPVVEAPVNDSVAPAEVTSALGADPSATQTQ